MDEVGLWFWLWVVAAVLLFVGEIFTAGFFLLPFGVGASVAAVLAFLQISIAWQWAAFIVVSTLAFISMRGLADRMTHDPPVKTGSDRLIGKTGVVIQEILPHSSTGEVRIERETWRADAPGHAKVTVDTRIIVDRIEGTHLIVHPEVEQTPEAEVASD